MTEIRMVQAAAWANKQAKGFNTTDVPLEFCYLSAEVAEAFDAWRKGRADLGEELADVALFLVSLAEMTGIDLQTEINHKLTKNAGRQYVTGVTGLPVRLDQRTPFNPAYRTARCGQQSNHGPHVMDHGPDQPRNCPGAGVMDTRPQPGGGDAR